MRHSNSSRSPTAESTGAGAAQSGRMSESGSCGQGNSGGMDREDVDDLARSPVAESPRCKRAPLAGGPFPVDVPACIFYELEGHRALAIPVPPTEQFLEVDLGE